MDEEIENKELLCWFLADTGTIISDNNKMKKKCLKEFQSRLSGKWSRMYSSNIVRIL